MGKLSEMQFMTTRVPSEMSMPDIDLLIQNRFRADRMLYSAPSLAVFEGFDKSTKSSIRIIVTNNETISFRLNQLADANEIREEIQKVLAKGILNEHAMHYFVLHAPFSNDGISPLEQNLYRLGVNEKISVFIDLCHILEDLHGQSIYLDELSPDLILINDRTLKLETILLPIGLSSTKINIEYLLDGIEMEDSVIHNTLEWMNLVLDASLQEYLSMLRQKGHYLEGWMFSLLNPFLSPNVVSRELNSKKDIFSVGILLFWLFVGETPFISYSVGTREQKELYPFVVFSELNLIHTLEYIYHHKLMGVKQIPQKGILIDLHPIIERATNCTNVGAYENIRQLRNDLIAIASKSLRIRVLDDSGSSVPGMKVVVKRKDVELSLESEPITVHTDGTGTTEISDLLGGRYSIAVRGNTKYSGHSARTVDLHEQIQEVEIKVKRTSLGDRIKNLWRNK
jgi:serine/threonine protein kinase